jgi:hypothetical protein
MTSSFSELALLPYYISEIVGYVALVGMGYLAWRVVRAYERRSLEPDLLRGLTRRLKSLEATVETVEDQVRQTSEAQRFTTTLMVRRWGLPGEEAHGASKRHQLIP